MFDFDYWDGIVDDLKAEQWQLLVWLQDAENDLGDLAAIVQALAARSNQRSLADQAERIAHKWAYRRNRREQRDST